MSSNPRKEKEMNYQIIQPDYPRWEEFTDKLSATLYAHSEKDGIEFLPEGRCRGDLRHSERILRLMDNVDVEATLEHFRGKIGKCDHLILVMTG
jgi:hypothetical protein